MTKPIDVDKAFWLRRIKLDMAYAVKRLLEKQTIAPLFIIYSGEMELIIFVPDFSDLDAKRASQSIATIICAAYDAIAVSFLSEAWMRNLKAAEGETAADVRLRGASIAPSEAPDRIEVVIVTLGYRDPDTGAVRHMQALSEILRARKKGPPSGVKPLVEPDLEHDTLEGPMADILPSRPVTPQQRADFRALLTMMGVKVEPKPMVH